MGLPIFESEQNSILLLGGEHKFLGRRVIYTSREQINQNTIPQIINGAMTRHLMNRAEIKYLYRYFKGDQPILQRVKLIRPDVNNKIVINNAFSIARQASGYFLGEPIQYTAKDIKDSDSISKLNAFMDSENKACEDMSIGYWNSICGTGYRLVAVDDSGEEDEAAFEIPTLEPQNTFVVYSTKVGHKPVLGVTYTELLNDDGSTVGTTFTVYDGVNQYIYTVHGGYTTQVQTKNLISVKPHFLGDVPIVEYPNNEWRLGDFEVALTVLDAINKLHSDRVNSVEQIVNSILVFLGCHLNTAEENKGKGGVSDFDRLKDELAIELPTANGDKADVKYVNSHVDQNEAETLAQTLIDYVYAVTGIPDRKSSASGSGGDTGDAVYLRDGFQSLEVVARIKERNFKKAERTSLRMICKILDKFNDIKLRPMQIDVRFVRNRTNNLYNKSQSAINLQKTRMISAEDIITLLGITEMPGEMAKRGQDYWSAQANTSAKTLADQAVVGKSAVSTDTATQTDTPTTQTADNSNGGNGYGGKLA